MGFLVRVEIFVGILYSDFVRVDGRVQVSLHLLSSINYTNQDDATKKIGQQSRDGDESKCQDEDADQIV